MFLKAEVDKHSEAAIHYWFNVLDTGQSEEYIQRGSHTLLVQCTGHRSVGGNIYSEAAIHYWFNVLDTGQEAAINYWFNVLDTGQLEEYIQRGSHTLMVQCTGHR